jgi:hypothetical protein
LTTKLSLRGRVGKQRKTIRVSTNDPSQPNLTLALEGTATTEIEVRPRRIYARDLVPGQVNVRHVEIVSNTEEPVELGDVTSGSPLVEAEVETVEEGSRFRLVVRTKPNMPKGRTFGQIQVKTNSEKVPTLRVPFHYEVVGEVSVIPREIILMGRGGDRLTRKLMVRPGLVKEFKVEEVEPPVAAMRATVTPRRDAGFDITLENIEPTRDLNGKSLRITTDIEGMKEILVPFKVLVRPDRPSPAPYGPRRPATDANPQAKAD